MFGPTMIYLEEQQQLCRYTINFAYCHREIRRWLISQSLNKGILYRPHTPVPDKLIEHFLFLNLKSIKISEVALGFFFSYCEKFAFTNVTS